MKLQNLLPAFALVLLFPLVELSANYHLDEINCNQTIYLEGTTGRKAIYLTSETETLELCGLITGQEYIISLAGENGCDPDLGLSTMVQNKNELIFTPLYECTEITISLITKKQICGGHLTISYATKNKKKSTLNKMLAPISVIGGVDATTLIEDIFIGGGCFEVSNAVRYGNSNAAGIFSGGQASLGIDEGVILSTGNVTNAQGPNNEESVTTDWNGQPGDNDLDDVLSANGDIPDTEDRVALEFDFTPTVDMIQFNYVFASDEYCRWVNTDYTDIFGFFISGPGINGGFTLGAENIALIPGTGTSVSINTVNDVDNSGFFVPNRAGFGLDGCGAFTSDDVEFDGWTTMFTAVANVQACETYHIKLVIADNRDGTLDSAVFLEANSFSAGVQAEGEAVSAITGTNIVYEQCPDGSFIFKRAAGSSLDEDIVITYTIGGTATPGSDYDPLPFSVTIPAGQTSVTLPVNIIPDALIEGQESIILTLDNPCNCSGILVEMLIEDSLPMEASMEDQEVCGTGSVTLSPTITGGVGTFTYMWDTGASGSSITVSPTEPTTYIVTVTDECMNTDTASATVIVSQPPTAEIDGMYNLCEGATPPTVDIPVTFTGNPPWTFNYTIGGVPQPPITTSDNPYILTVVLTGDVSLVDVSTGTGGSCPGTVMGSVSTNLITISASIESTPEQCEGASDGTITVTASGGTEPYTYDWSHGGPDSPTQTGLPAGSYSVIVTDADGCTTNASATIDPATPLTASLDAVEANCTNGGSGNITSTVNGGTPTYTYAWSDGSSNPNLSNTPAGTYTVTVTDNNGCTAEATADIADNTTPPDAVANGMGVIDCNNEEMQIDGNGSSTGGTITYQWSGPGIVSGGTTLSPTINAGGTYTILVTDTNSGCTAEATVDIEEDMNEPDAVANLGPFDCATSTLELDGNGSSTGSEFTYQWSGPGIVSGGTTLNPTIDEAGTYTILVTNTTNGCTAEASVSPNPPEELTVSLTPMEANCTNNGGGNINSTVSGGSPNYTYAWSDGSSNPNLSNAPAGTYTVTVTDDNGCTAEATADIADNTTPPEAVANGVGIIDCNNEEIQIDGNGSSTGSTITYQWSGPSIVSGGTTLTPTINAGGTYTILVTDTNSGCTAEATVDIEEDLTPPDAAASGGELDCNNETIIIDGIGSSQGGEFTYQWSGPGIVSGGSTLTPEVDQPGTYTILVINTTNGCTAEASTNITDNSIDPTAVANFTNLTCAMTTVELNGQGSSTGSGITYQWTGPGLLAGETTLNPTIDQPGTYELTVTNGNNGCTATVSVNVQENITPPNAVIQDPDDLGCLVTEIDLTTNGSSTGSTMVYNWNGPGIISGSGSNSPTVNQPGTYILVITNTANGCTAEASVEVIENVELPIVEIADPDVIDCNNPTIMLDGTGSTNEAGTTYQWFGPSVVSGGNTLNPEVDQTGTYTLVVTNSLGCTASETVDVSDNLNYPFADAGPPQTITCTETTVFLDGIASDMGPNITYQWLDENGNPVPNGTNNSIETGQTGTYEIVVTETGSGCTSSAFVTVDANSNVPVAEIFPPDLLTCAINEVELNATITNATNVSAVWSTIDGEIIAGGNTLNPIVGQIGIYEVILTDEDSGCTAVATTEVMIDDMPPVAVIQDPPVLGCTPTVVELSGVGSTFDGNNQTYIWSDNIVGNQGTLVPLIIDPGIYTLTVINDLNGCTAEASVEVIQEIIEPEITIADPEFLNCFNNEITLDATGSDDSNGTTYQWLDENGDEINDADELTFTVMQGGMFTFVVTTATGCTNEMSVTVDEDLVSPTADAGPNQMITCTESTVTLDGSNSSTGVQFGYQWLNANGNEVEDEITFVTEEAGTYELIVTNLQNGCTANEFVTVSTNSDVPTVSVDAPQNLDCISTQISLNATTNSPNAVIEWTTNDGEILNGANTLTPTIGQSGTYEIIITDNTSGCTAVGSAIVIEDNDLPEVLIANPENLDCSNPATLLDASMSSTNGNFQYDWSTIDGNILSGQNTLELEVDAGGTYLLTISNLNNNCSATEEVIINENFIYPTATAGAPQTIGCGVDSLFLNGAANSTNNPFLETTWTTPDGNILTNDSTLNPTIDAPGTYTLTVLDPTNGCTATAFVGVAQNTDAPAITIGPDGAITCTTTNLDLSATVDGNTSNFIYEWTTSDGNIAAGANTLTPNVDAAGMYQLVVTDTINNCTDMAMLNVTEDADIPQADIEPAGSLSCNSTSVTLDASNSTTGTGITYEWTTSDGNFTSGQTTLSPTIDAPGLYTLTVIDANNDCINSTGITVEMDTLAPTVIPQADGVLTCEIEEINLDGSNSTTNGDLTYLWTTIDGEILNGEDGLNPLIGAAGTYTLTIIDNENGCDNSADILIEASAEIPTIAIEMPPEINCFNDSINLDATNSDSGTTYEFEWTTMNGNLVNLDNPLEPVVDASGIYNLLITNTLTGCSATQEVEVFENLTLPIADAGNTQEITCTTQSVALNGENSSLGVDYSYEWSTMGGIILSGGSTLTPNVAADGIYEILVTNETNGCTAIAAVEITENTTPPDAVIADPETLNCYQDTLNLDAAASSQGANFTYEWTTTNGNIVSGENTLTPEIDEDGFYQILVTNETNGCTATFFTEVTDNFETPLADAGPEFILSCGDANVTLDGGLSTVNTNVTYEWISQNGNILSGQNALDPTVNATGVYTLIVTNTDSGCSATSETEVTQDDDLPNADAGTADPITCNVLSVSLDGTNSDNGTGFTFEWTTTDGSFESGENTLTPTVNSPGVYILTITNEDNDCFTISSVTVPENTNPPLADAGVSEELSCTIETLSLDGGNSASGNGFSYEWTTTGGNIVEGENTLTPDIDEPGIYQILVTDLITGCTATDEVEITESLDVPVAAIADPDELTCAELEVALDANPSSQGANITYEWVTVDGNILTGENTTTPTINEPGTYEIIVTDTDNGCTNSSIITVSQNVETPNAEAGEADDLDCDTDVVSLNGEGSTIGSNVMYEWTTMNGEITAGANTLTPTVGAVGEYQIEVMDMDNGCSSMDMVIVESDEDLPLTVIANPEQLTCTDEVVILNGENSDSGPNFEFEWTTQGGNILNAPNSMNLEVDAAGTYTLTITNNENGCTETASVSVDQDVEEPTVDAGESFTLDCLQDVEFLEGSADGNGAAILTNWTTTNGILQSGINTLSPGIAQAGVYTLTVTNLENGCTAVDEVLIETDGPIGSFFIQNPLCYNTPGAISFQNIQGGEPPYVYSIDNGNNYFDSGFFPNLPAGQYSLVVQDANGCEHLETTQITQPEEVIVKITIDEATISLGEDFQIVAQTTIPDAEIDTIIWTPDNTLSCGDCLTPVATPDAATVYSVVVTDHNGCSGQDALFLSVEKNREVHAPNAFSPNGDGENEVFMLFTDDKSVKKIKSFLVFNRWGETVYQYYNFDPNQPAFGWDGRHRGQMMNPAVFAWFAEVEFIDGSTKLFEGDVTLMR